MGRRWSNQNHIVIRHFTLQRIQVLYSNAKLAQCFFLFLRINVSFAHLLVFRSKQGKKKKRITRWKKDTEDESCQRNILANLAEKCHRNVSLSGLTPASWSLNTWHFNATQRSLTTRLSKQIICHYARLAQVVPTIDILQHKSVSV